MLIRKIAIAALAILAAANAGAKDKKPVDPQEVLCKSTMPTGTRFPKKVCHTRETWEEIAENAKRQGAEMINRPVIAPPGN